MVGGLASGAFEVEDGFPYTKGYHVELDGGEGFDPGVYVFLGARWGVNIPVPLGVGFAESLLALDVEGPDGVDYPVGGVVSSHDRSCQDHSAQLVP